MTVCFGFVLLLLQGQMVVSMRPHLDDKFMDIFSQIYNPKLP